MSFILKESSLVVLYVVSHALPFSNNGYAVRTHGIAKALASSGIKVIVLIRPGRPTNYYDEPSHSNSIEHIIEGVRYLYLPHVVLQRSRQEKLRIITEAIVECIQVFKPNVILAASNWQNALPAMNAAERKSLPFWYEVRGFWELSRLAREPEYADTEEFRLDYEGERLIASNAEKVFTLTSQMIDELVLRGVESSKIGLIPNGVDILPDRVELSEGSRQTGIIIGYIGSFTIYEGLEDLIRAFSQLYHNSLVSSLIIVGSSADLDKITGQCQYTRRLMELAYELGIEKVVSFPGRVSGEKLTMYYRKIDIFVIPRKPFKVCQLVSPIKPLEAGGYEKAILTSDVAPLQDMASEAGFFTFRAGDVDDLKCKLEELVINPAICQRASMQVRDWVSSRRMFTQTVEQLRQAIEELS